MKNFSKISILNEKMYVVMQNMLQAANFHVNEYRMIQTNKGKMLTTKILHKTENTRIELNQNRKNRLLQETNKKIQAIFDTNEKLDIEVANSFFPKFEISQDAAKQKNNFDSVNYTMLKKKQISAFITKIFQLIYHE